MNYELVGENVSNIFQETRFPAGEVNVTLKNYKLIIPDTDVYFVDAGTDLMRIAQKVDILNNYGARSISLVLPYLPFSRQDRYTTIEHSFALKQYAKLLNTFNFKRVYSVDPHSDVSGVIDNFVPLDIKFIVQDIIDEIGNPIILVPDAGAHKKIFNTLEGLSVDILVATKHRDLKTGAITKTTVPEIPEGRKILIVDDISDGGRTFIEIAKAATLISTSVWGPMTSATIANRFRVMIDKYQKETGGPEWFSDFQAHDFSMRGMNGLEAAEMSGAGHLLSSLGTDTIPAILYLEKYYEAGKDGELIGASVPATEHSVMCAGGQDDEKETYLRLINDVHPSGIISIVSDTWDFWEVVTKLLPDIKHDIMNREGKVVIRPDSGNPVKTLVGDPSSNNVAIQNGLIETLWGIFGGTINEKGFKELDPHIGAIYGDSITYDRGKAILEGLKEKGFASSNVVFGVGSYTYQYNTRDTFGFAMKATGVVIDREEKAIFKDPKTDSGLKKSAKGFLKVVRGTKGLELVDEIPFSDIEQGELKLVFRDGKEYNIQTLTQIRNLLASQR